MEPVPPLLPATPLLRLCPRPLDANGNEAAEGLFRYAASTVKTLLKEETAAYDKLKLSVYDGVICGVNTVAELTRKRHPHASEYLCAKLMPCLLLELLMKGKPLFIYGLTCESSGFALLPPRRITALLSDNVQGMEKIAAALQKSAVSRRSPFPLGLKRRTDALKLKISVSLMRSAADDLRFVSRFNEETFFRGFSDTQLFSSPLLDLSEKSVRSGFTSLYAMTFFGLTDRDVFTVDGVFGFTDIGVRSKDDKRQKAAEELSSRIMGNDLADLADMADKMGARLLELDLPPVNVDDPMTLAQNCTLYAGFARIGKAYSSALSGLEIALAPDDPGSSCKPAKRRARLMAQYDCALQLCQGILTLLTVRKPRISALKGYKQAQELERQLESEVRK